MLNDARLCSAGILAGKQPTLPTAPVSLRMLP